jgi:hypothetical protein
VDGDEIQVDAKVETEILGSSGGGQMMISLPTFSLFLRFPLLTNLLSSSYPQHARCVNAHLLKSPAAEGRLVVRPRIEARTSWSRSLSDVLRHFKLDRERLQHIP